MGAALASIGAASVINLGWWSSNEVQLVTIGQPRVGDLAYAMQHDKLVRVLAASLCLFSNEIVNVLNCHHKLTIRLQSLLQVIMDTCTDRTDNKIIG